MLTFRTLETKSASLSLNTRSLGIPSNRYRLVVAGEFLPSKPKLEPQISRRHDDSNIELADVELVAPRETCPSFVFKDQLLLPHAVEVTSYVAYFSCSG